SQKLCVEEGIIKASLKYLKAKGFINYILSEDHSKVFIFQGSGKERKTNIAFLEKSLKNALMEKNAYKEFILKMDKEKFKEYLK
ncbi:MAG TPA: single-stranded-DNA-specific exonuclease RecJ, partial [Acetivibrio saccincola]|nr:single-stranded-DNA-specific exonuclease RecJ [Acetivibrio saccincola]